jgi:hypothetical protein
MEQRSHAALVVAHPGHELRLHGWLERATPLVFVITDGSARSQSRIPSSRVVIEAIGGKPGSIFGRFTDADLYAAILRCDADQVAAATRELSEALAANDIEQVVCDAWENYNPAHDLCRVMTALAVDRARTISDRAIAFYDYAVVGATGATDAACEIVIDLDDDALARKLAAARAFDALRNDVEEQLRDGSERFRIECLRPASVDVILPQRAERPAYELVGEARVAAGRYATVLRYHEHFVPFVKAIAAKFSGDDDGR